MLSSSLVLFLGGVVGSYSRGGGLLCDRGRRGEREGTGEGGGRHVVASRCTANNAHNRQRLLYYTRFSSMFLVKPATAALSPVGLSSPAARHPRLRTKTARIFGGGFITRRPRTGTHTRFAAFLTLQP